MKILICDPDEYYHASFNKLLDDIGTLVFAKTMRDTLKKIEKEAPDIMVLELLLPDDTGYSLLERIRKNDTSANLPVIVYSRVNNLPDIQTALHYGVAGYFVKGDNHLNEVRGLLLSFSN